jgi:hypothetical protein
MDGLDPLPRWCDDTCGVCPAQLLGPGRFDVLERPGREFAYNPSIGWRVALDGTAVCVHPYRVGMPPGRYASAAEPLPDLNAAPPTPSPAALDLPDSLDDLEGWFVATLRVAPPDHLFAAVAQAERAAGARFAPGAVVTALRRVLSVELARR